MAKITKIEKQAKYQKRVNIFVDEKFAFGMAEALLVDFNLFEGKELSEKEIENIKLRDDLSKCLFKAYRFLSYRMRTEKEMRDKLSEKFERGTVNKALEKLKEYNLINDAEFTKTWIKSRLAGRSKKALRFELFKKGVAKSMIEDYLSEVAPEEEFEAAKRLIDKRKKYDGLIGQEAYQKIGSFLARRGYSYDIIKKVLKSREENSN